MTVEELIKMLEKFDKDKRVALSIETDFDYFIEPIRPDYFDVRESEDKEVIIDYSF